MARAAWEAGTRVLVCTPHLLDWDPGLMERARAALIEMRSALAAEEIGLRLLLGFEADITVIAGADESKLAALAITDPEDEPSQSGLPVDSDEADARGGVSGVAGPWRGAILIETPYHGWPPFLEESLFQVSAAGYTPILAHPERNERIQRSPELLEACIRAGVIAQGTAGSLADMFRRHSQRTFMDLLARGQLHLLASDGHAHVPYTWSLASLKEELSKRISQERFEVLTHTNPERVLRGERPLPARSGEGTGGSRRSWWRR
jgi:tyrosine-protein phosphatase YwqE